MSKILNCPLLNRDIPEGYCFDLCNIATDDILVAADKGKIKDWEKAQETCKECGQYEE